MSLSAILGRYPKNNNDWNLVFPYGDPPSLGKRISWDYNQMLNNRDIDMIPVSVVCDIHQYSGIDQFFIRNIVTRDKFMGDDAYDKLNPYNSDPWGREMIVYVGNVVHPQYAYIKNREKWTDSYISLYFKDMVAKYSGMHSNDESRIPLFVLYTTLVNREKVYCLDVIQN